MMVHYCQGCCSSREEALDNVTAAVLQAALVKGFSSVTPSKGRHGSTTEALGEPTFASAHLGSPHFGPRRAGSQGAAGRGVSH